MIRVYFGQKDGMLDAFAKALGVEGQSCDTANFVFSRLGSHTRGKVCSGSTLPFVCKALHKC